MPPISAFAAYKSTNLQKKNKQKKDKLKGVQKQNRKLNPIAVNGKKKKNSLSKNLLNKDNDETEANEESFYTKPTDILDCTSEDEQENLLADQPTTSKAMQQKLKKTSKQNTTSASLNSQPNAASTAKKSKKNQSLSSANGSKSLTKEAKYKETAEPLQKNLMLSNVVKSSSIVQGEKAFQWLINPMSVEQFFNQYWEKNALLLKRNNPKLYQSLISFKAIDKMLADNIVEFTKNIDVTSYESGVRETHNPDGRAVPSTVWDFYSDGCSVRLLNPQTFLKPLHELCATMQEYFHCLVGVNAYLTPPNSQGFAPHYDDIEAFVIQVEGRKRWRLYKPRSTAEVLPRFSSPNFSQEEIGEPILEDVLEPGDVLYFPRGTIHQACTEPGYHSLHITLSVYQKQSYADLLEKMLPQVLTRAIASNVNLRRGLPLNIWRNAGIVNSENNTQERANLEEEVEKVVRQCLTGFELTKVMDYAVDELALKYQNEAMPPIISRDELPHTVFGINNTVDKGGFCLPNCPINLRSNVRLLRANIIRLVCQEGQLRMYYYLDNSKEYCQYEPNFIEIEPELGSSVEVLINSYPEYVGVSQLPMDHDETKVDLVTVMWKRGLLMTEKPFKN